METQFAWIYRFRFKEINNADGGGGVIKPAPDEDEKAPIEHLCKHSNNDNKFGCNYNYKENENECNCNTKLEKYKTNEDNYSCSLCENKFIKGTELYGCRDCNVDLCINCYNKINPKK